MEPLRVFQKSDLLIFPVRLRSRSSGSEIVGLDQGVLTIRLTAPPVQNQANRQLLGFLAKALGLTQQQVSIVSGHRSPIKRVGLKGISKSELLTRIAEHIV